jgi:hypothetical protein
MKNTFGFLFLSDKLISMNDKSFSSSEVLWDLMTSESMGPFDILKYLGQRGCFSKASVAYRIC